MKYIYSKDEAINLYGQIDPEIVGLILRDIVFITRIHNIESLYKSSYSIIILEENESLETLTNDVPHISTIAPEFIEEIQCHITNESWKHYLISQSNEYMVSIYQKQKK